MPHEQTDDNDALEKRWTAWQQRGIANDSRRRHRMGAAAAVVVLILTGWLSWAALGVA